jgi:hypothetical protein
VGLEEVTCLCSGEGDEVLAGLADGRVCRVDSATLELAEVAKLPAALRWVGRGRAAANHAAGLLAVTTATKTVTRDGRTFTQRYSEVHDLAASKTYPLKDQASTFLLDHAGRFWAGSDNGEWGGSVARIDLAGGSIEQLKPPPPRRPYPKIPAYWRGVYGFIELRDGQVWEYGGTSHMGSTDGEIVRVDGPAPRILYAFDFGEDAGPGQPRLPFTHILEEDSGLLVFSYHEIFRVARTLTAWKQAGTLKIRYRWGRPDAVGTYPSVRAIHSPRLPGEPYLIATIGDGFVSWSGDKTTPHAIPGQLGAESVDRVENTSEGTLFFESDDQLPAWRQAAQGWEVAKLAPPLEPDPANTVAEFEKRQGSWSETRVMVRRDGTIFTVSNTSISPGSITTARRSGGKSERIGRETGEFFPSASFLTADGKLWNAFSGTLKRFEAGRWATVARFPQRRATPYHARPLSPEGPPWLLLDREGLWRLDHGPRGQDPRIAREDVRQGGTSLRVRDAMPWSGRSLMLATEAGLRVYDPATKQTSRTEFPDLAQPATTLTRDGLNRLWLGNEQGLWWCEARAKALDPIP